MKLFEICLGSLAPPSRCTVRSLTLLLRPTALEPPGALRPADRRHATAPRASGGRDRGRVAPKGVRGPLVREKAAFGAEDFPKIFHVLCTPNLQAILRSIPRALFVGQRSKQTRSASPETCSWTGGRNQSACDLFVKMDIYCIIQPTPV